MYYELLFKEAGGWGMAQPPPVCKPLEKVTVAKMGSLLAAMPVHVLKKRRVMGGDSPPSVQTVEIEGCDD